MISEDGQVFEGGSEGENGGLGSLSNSGEELRPESGSGSDSKRFLGMDLVKSGGGELQFGEGLSSLPIQGGREERFGTPPIVGDHQSGIGSGAIAAQFLSIGGGHLIGPNLDLIAIAFDGAQNGDGDLECS